MMTGFEKDARVDEAKRELQEARWGLMEAKAVRHVMRARNERVVGDWKAQVIRAKIALERAQSGRE